MKHSAFSLSFLCIIVCFLISFWSQASAHAHPHEDFLQCLSHNFSNSTTFAELIYTANDPSYISVLNSTLQNPRFSSPLIQKPLVIITPSNSCHVQATVYCSKKHGLQIRTRGGGHDFEGLSYVSEAPFVIIDLRNRSAITVDVHEKTAWVEARAILGEVYYRIAEKVETSAFLLDFAPL